MPAPVRISPALSFAHAQLRGAKTLKEPAEQKQWEQMIELLERDPASAPAPPSRAELLHEMSGGYPPDSAVQILRYIFTDKVSLSLGQERILISIIEAFAKEEQDQVAKEHER